MKSVLITGANGFIGSHLTKLISELKIEVYAMVQENTDYKIIQNLNNVKIIEYNLLDLEHIHEKLPCYIDVLYHLAWVGVSTTQKNMEEIQLPNIQYSLNILKLAHKLNIKKIIYPGSVSEYAYNCDAVNGYNIPSPADFYSATKVATHYICDLYARQNDINFIWALIPSIYGPGREDNNLITYAIKSFLKGERPVFTKLEQIWDYIYIDDLIMALYKIGKAGQKQEVYTIGSGENKRLSDYVYIIRDAINKDLPLGIGEMPYKTNKIDNSIVDISKLRNHTGFQPKYMFEDGIRKTIQYFIENISD